MDMLGKGNNLKGYVEDVAGRIERLRSGLGSLENHIREMQKIYESKGRRTGDLENLRRFVDARFTEAKGLSDKMEKLGKVAQHFYE